MQLEKRQKALKQRLGVLVFIALAILTAVEFWVSLALSRPTPYLTVIALAKAGLIVKYFMHLMQLWREEA